MIRKIHMKRISKCTAFLISAIMAMVFSSCAKVADSDNRPSSRNGENYVSSGNDSSGNKVLSGEIASKEHVL